MSVCPVICKEHWKELFYTSLIHCINYFRRISKGSSRHEHRAAKACMHYLLNQGQKNVWEYVDIWISHSSHSCIFSLSYWWYTFTYNLQSWFLPFLSRPPIFCCVISKNCFNSNLQQVTLLGFVLTCLICEVEKWN